MIADIVHYRSRFSHAAIFKWSNNYLAWNTQIFQYIFQYDDEYILLQDTCLICRIKTLRTNTLQATHRPTAPVHQHRLSQPSGTAQHQRPHRRAVGDANGRATLEVNTVVQRKHKRFLGDGKLRVGARKVTHAKHAVTFLKVNYGCYPKNRQIIKEK